MSETDLSFSPSPIKGYRLFRQIARFPDLLPQMRSTFLDVLVERGVIARGDLAGIVGRYMAADGVPDTEASRAEYTECIIDLLFASVLSPEEVENRVNLVRKRDRCQELGRVVSGEHASTETIWRALREFCDIPKGELYISREEAEGIRVALLSHYVSSQLPFIGIAKNHVTIRDIDTVLGHTIGHVTYPGKLGGKTAGMIVAQKILLPILSEREPDFEKYIAVPDTWYISSGVMSDFIDRNHFYGFHTHKYRDRDAIDEEFKLVGGLFEKAAFPPDVVEEFRTLIRQIGEHPIIVRSSSYLEDSFGLAFSGKYQSIFLPNQGSEEQRLAAFIRGIKTVLASMYGPDPIIYRRDHGLLDFNERMAMIVQKVVGRRFGDWLFPLAAGVMYSSNAWVWNPRIRKSDGLVRLVFGLGTRAVDRVGGDYPRMIPLSHPALRPEVTPEQISRYSQKMVDAINLRTGEFTTIDFRTLAAESRHPDLFLAASLMEEGEMRAPLFRTQELPPSSLCLTFENLLTKSAFVPLVKKVLSTVQAAYGRPVDIEFAWDDNKLYILQCRSLSMRREVERVVLPVGVRDENTLFITQSGLTNAVITDVEYVVYVDPRSYDRLDTVEKKHKVGWAVGQLNKRLAGHRYALMGPGRWGSNDINLGVRVSYSDINSTRLLVEIAFARDGYTPEVSYGTHFFQDLVEADIAIMPLYPDTTGSRLNEEFLLASRNAIADVDPALAALASVIHVIHVPAVRDGLLLQVFLDGESQKGIGMFAPAAGSAQK
ncbi:MAG: PEP/pyruvate-binding domain-containing protein [Spirochaetia bacterium]